MPREILVNWQTPAGSGFVNVFYFETTGISGPQRIAIQDFLNSIETSLATSVTWEIATEGRDLDDATGALTGVWSEGTIHNGQGDSATQTLPDASQILFRWATDVIVGGRMLKGRTFIPGAVVGNMDGGNLGPTVVADFSSKAQDFVDAAVGFGVWHRPVLLAGGSFEEATTGTAWSELAVLRRRRQ